MVKMANLLGLRDSDAKGSRLEALSKASWGDFADLTDLDGSGLAVSDRVKWARARLVERIDEEVAKLDAHLETLDLEAIARDRAEAGDRALFDASKEATLARRYESAARRGFYQALKELRRIEAEVEVPAEVEASEPAQPVVEAPGRLASCCESLNDRPEAVVELTPPPIWPPSSTFSTARTADGQVLTVGKPSLQPA
jgi:hypothetical protein